MPNRFLKESVCTSETIDKLSPEAEVFFYRLIVNCDDFGRMDARPAVLRAKLFPLRIDSITESDTARWLKQCQEAGLLSIYSVREHPYLVVMTWRDHQQIRADASRYPDPPEPLLSATAPKRKRLLANVSNGSPALSADNDGEHMSPYSYSYPETNSKTNPELRQAAAPAAPNGVSPFLTYAICLDRLQESGANKNAVLGDALLAWFGHQPDYGRLGRLANEIGGHGTLAKLMWELAPGWNGVDDPHNLIAGAVRRRKAEKQTIGGRAVDRSPISRTRDYAAMTAERDAQEAAKNAHPNGTDNSAEVT